MEERNNMVRFGAVLAIILVFASVGSADDAPFVYKDRGRRDPMWPLVTPSGAIMSYESEMFVSDMILEGIIVDPSGQNLAIINGVIVKNWDKVGQYIVKNISTTSVVLIKGQEEFILKLKKEE